jgi:two-component system KDP operon response regulator KdpE
MKESLATILLIEDERQMRRFLRVTLQSEKYIVLEAETAIDGLSQAATRSPDIILLDLGLPDMDGLEVIEKLREWSAIPVIVISAREQEGDKIKALDKGADDYLTKPFSAGDLLESASLSDMRRSSNRIREMRFLSPKSSGSIS